MKLLIFLTLFLTLLSSEDKYSSGLKPTKKGVAPVNNALYINECGSCHFAYQPGLLPANAWEKMMGNLENHFDTDASLSQEDFITISNYLKQNSAEKNMDYKRSSRIVNSLKGRQIPDSISQTPYMIEKHNEIRPSLITQKEVKGIFNCIACHTTADKGIYSERDIRIPNFGRWKD
ncbi:MAG: diheme cytochrome c [Arcobacteraceae bacterium]|nr:diheme cytochrome c [Arcobacteraceae bacterium]